MNAQVPKSTTIIRVNKQQNKMIRQIDKKLNDEADKQVDIIYNSLALALYRHHGWRVERITKLVLISHKVFCEVGSDNNSTIIQKCWDEVGVSLQAEGRAQDWENIIWLNSEKDVGKPMDAFQYIAMRQNQIKWIPTDIMACVLISLKRKEGWGVQRLGRLFQEVEEIKNFYHLDPKELRKQATEETGFELTEKELIPSEEEVMKERNTNEDNLH